MTGRPPSVDRVVHVLLLGGLVAGCTTQAPTAPGLVGAPAIAGVTEGQVVSPAAVSGARAPAAARVVRTFDLREGQLTLSLADGTSLAGTYHGVATAPSTGQAKATLEGIVTGGTGMFDGATGAISGAGTGAFSGDGPFSVSLRVSVTTADGSTRSLRVALKGTTTSTCTTTAPPRMFLDGEGTVQGAGAASGRLEHDLGTRVCAVIIID